MKIAMILLLFLTMSTMGSAQSLVSVEQPRKFTQAIDRDSAPVRKVTRTHRRLMASYTGYLIELTVADLPLRRDHHLFQKFGNIAYVKRADGKYVYLIPVDFRKRTSVEDYLNNIVSYKAPGARVVEYKRGVEMQPTTNKERRFRFD